MTLPELSALLDVLRANGVTHYNSDGSHVSLDLVTVPSGARNKPPSDDDEPGGMPTRAELFDMKDEIDKKATVGPRRDT